MALSRRTGHRFQASIWPGFVDAMTGLLLVLMFVLTIFMVVQFSLRETITGQESELDTLSAEVAALSRALGLEQDRSATLQERVGALTSTLTDARERQEQQTALIASLTADNAAAEDRIASFEAQVASLLAERDTALGQVDDLETARDTLLSDKEALELALAGLRDEMDAEAEAARLAAAQRDAMEALAADLRAEAEGNAAELSDAEAARLAEAAVAEALREKLAGAQSELTAMTLALEEKRREAEETLTLLAAARQGSADLEAQLAAALAARSNEAEAIASLEAARDAAEARGTELEAELAAQNAEAEARVAALEAELAALKADQELSQADVRARLAAALAAKLAAEQEAGAQMTAAEERAALLSEARKSLNTQKALTAEAERAQEVLNQQVAALRDQLGQLQALLDDSKAREAASDVQMQSLGQDLNAALARVAAEEKRRREAEQEKNRLLEAEKQDLEKYRSDFFGRLRDLLGNQDGVRIVGDRFVFSSEVLFAPGQATLSEQGKNEIGKVAEILRNVAGDIPDEIDWVIRVDGHTDDVPIIGSAQFADNWELSQARALSVVRYMIDFLGLPPSRLAANGFGQFQPIASGDTAEARAQNRRIELKFTEK